MYNMFERLNQCLNIDFFVKQNIEYKKKSGNAYLKFSSLKHVFLFHIKDKTNLDIKLKCKNLIISFEFRLYNSFIKTNNFAQETDKTTKQIHTVKSLINKKCHLSKKSKTI